MGKGDSSPLTLFKTDGSERLDLVNSPSLAGTGDPFYRNSIGPTISISADGNRFAFVSALNYNDYTRLWVADIFTGSAGSSPSISDITLTPNYVVVGAGGFASVSAAISGGGSPILKAGFSGFNNGTYEFIIGNSNYFWLYDDATHGDIVAADGIFSVENIFTNITENPVPGNIYMLRFSAATEHRATVVDVEPFYIRNTPIAVENESYTRPVPTHELLQNYPNPFNPVTTISYRLPVTDFVTLKIFDLTGKEITTLINQKQDAGVYNVYLDGNNLASGIYFYQLYTTEFVDSKKCLLIK